MNLDLILEDLKKMRKLNDIQLDRLDIIYEVATEIKTKNKEIEKTVGELQSFGANVSYFHPDISAMRHRIVELGRSIIELELYLKSLTLKLNEEITEFLQSIDVISKKTLESECLTDFQPSPLKRRLLLVDFPEFTKYELGCSFSGYCDIDFCNIYALSSKLEDNEYDVVFVYNDKINYKSTDEDKLYVIRLNANKLTDREIIVEIVKVINMRLSKNTLNREAKLKKQDIQDKLTSVNSAIRDINRKLPKFSLNEEIDCLSFVENDLIDLNAELLELSSKIVNEQPVITNNNVKTELFLMYRFPEITKKKILEALPLSKFVFCDLLRLEDIEKCTRVFAYELKGVCQPSFTCSSLNGKFFKTIFKNVMYSDEEIISVIKAIIE
jgi:hypothetical protein